MEINIVHPQLNTSPLLYDLIISTTDISTSTNSTTRTEDINIPQDHHQQYL